MRATQPLGDQPVPSKVEGGMVALPFRRVQRLPNKALLIPLPSPTPQPHPHQRAS